MRIAIFGLGYVGLTGAGCLIKQGHHVLGVEPSEHKLEMIRSGKSPIYEPGLDDLLTQGVQEGRLVVSQKIGGDLGDCDIAMVCVGTPSAPDGSHNMSYIAEVSRQIAHAVSPDRPKPLTVLFRSTFRPGTIETLVRPIFEQVHPNLSKVVELVYNPEFLRESTAIKDYFEPPKIVIGTKDGQPSENMDLLYKDLKAPVFYTGYREAEFTKFVDNSFHALKVAYANEIGRVCKVLDVDVKKVHEIFISDTKLNISPYYLRPGGAFGGSCLPKDVRALTYIANEVKAETTLINSIIESNGAHKAFVVDFATRGLKPGAKVLLVGLAFKAGSDDLRESPNIDISRHLIAGGFKLSIFDPNVTPAALVGANLGYAYAQLPDLGKLLISKEAAEAESYDLVIDAHGKLSGLDLKSPGRVFNVSNLT